MTRKELLASFLNLPAADRASIARRIITSLDGPSEEGASAAWTAEVARRADEVHDGAVQLVDWKKSRKRMQARLKKPAE